MSSITNTIASKLFVGFVAIAMALTLVAPAQAQTEAELQAQIDQLMATINSLQSQLGQTGGDTMTSGASVCPYAWTRSLTTGSTGADVMALQKFLNASADTQVAASGVGSAGMETEYFGGLSAAAVSKFQVKHRDSILTPVGLVNPTGYFGPSTMAKANALCASAPADGGDMDDDMMDDDDDMMDDTLNGGEADVDSYDFSDEEDEITEGEEDVPVLNVEFDVEDGDVRLERLDIRLEFQGGGSAESDPWDAFDELSIWVDGDKVASEDVTDEDDWDDISATLNEFRITQIDSIFREDTTGEVIIGLSAANGVDVDSTASNNNWDIYIPEDGFRFVDSEGLDIEGPSGGNGTASTFEVQEEGADDDLDLESSDADPDATTLALDEDDEQEYMVFAFELSAEDSDNDISIDNLYLDLVIGGGSTTDEIVDDLRIEIDGDSFDAESYDGSNATTNGIQFDIDGDSEVPADDVVTVEVFVNFNDIDEVGFGAQTITVSLDASTADIDAEGADDITTIGGSDQSGETHTLRLTGVDVELVDESATAIENDDTTNSDDEGKFVIEFDVTAFGEDIFIPFGASATTSLTSGVEVTILDDDNNPVYSGTTTLSLDSDGDEGTNAFEVDDGETVTLTVTVDFDPAASGSYKVRVDDVNFALTDVGTATESQDVSDLDIDTAKLTIQS